MSTFELGPSDFSNCQWIDAPGVKSVNLHAQIFLNMFVHLIECFLVLLVLDTMNNHSVYQIHTIWGSKFSHGTPRSFLQKSPTLLAPVQWFLLCLLPMLCTFSSATVSLRQGEPNGTQQSPCDRFRQWCNTSFCFVFCPNYPSSQRHLFPSKQHLLKLQRLCGSWVIENSKTVAAVVAQLSLSPNNHALAEGYLPFGPLPTCKLWATSLARGQEGEEEHGKHNDFWLSELVTVGWG